MTRTTSTTSQLHHPNELDDAEKKSMMIKVGQDANNGNGTTKSSSASMSSFEQEAVQPLTDASVSGIDGNGSTEKDDSESSLAVPSKEASQPQHKEHHNKQQQQLKQQPTQGYATAARSLASVVTANPNVLREGATVVPCRARGMSKNHNIRVRIIRNMHGPGTVKV